MSIAITVDGENKSANLVRVELREEYCDPGQHIEALFDQFFSVTTWKSITLTVDGTLVFTGSTSQIESARPDGTMMVRGGDDIKRLREYFVAEDYETAGEGVKHWVRFFAEMAGCTVTFLEDYDPIPLHGMTLSRMFAWEIVDELLLYAGWDIWCDENNVVNVGVRMRDVSPTESVTAGDNLVSLSRSRDSEPPRNRAIVYAAYGHGVASGTFGWEIDASDVRTMVVASPYIQNPAEAYLLATRMVSVAGPTYDIKRCETDEIDTGIKIGDLTTFDDGDGESGQDYITSRIITADGNTGEYGTFLKLGERCAKVGAGGLPIDGRDIIVATFECGVWRCYDIWADGGPVWYPLNTGLAESNIYDEVEYGSSFKCEWFIRDPFNPNGLAYLLTNIGIFQTASLETGYENWVPTLMNWQVGPYYGGSLGPNWTIRKIRSTIAARGQYYIVVAWEYNDYCYLGLTLDGFSTLLGGPSPPYGNFGTPQMPYLYSPFVDNRPYSSWLWGNCNYGHQKICDVQGWHHQGAYQGNIHGQGGLAAWHRNDYGCTASGVESAHASDGGPAAWNCHKDGYAYYPTTIQTPYAVTEVQPFTCLGIGGPLDPWKPYARGMQTYTFTAGGSTDWVKSPSIHIPYDQPRESWGGVPTYMFFSPGEWAGDAYGTYQAWPTLMYAQSHTKLFLPWGDAYSLCHRMQGSIGTYTPNRNKMQCWSWNTPSRFAVSDNMGLDWEERDSVPFWTSCFSGFPYSSQKVYCGRHPIEDPTSDVDRSLISVSWDRGETWVDVTGDLWTKTQALGLRFDQYNNPLGARGLVTIAPRYS